MTKTKARLISAGIAILLLATALFVLLPSVLSTTAGGAAWSGLPADGIETGAGTESNPYQIKTAEELAFMASKVNEGDTSYASAYYRLTTDIVLNESLDGTPNEWAAIGNDTTPFTGKFDGDGHTISGIKIDTTSDYQGLFGYSTGTIMNVGVINSDITGSEYVGGVCGANNGTINNCSNSAAVKGKGIIGGICGYNDKTIADCTNNGTVTDDGTESSNAFAGGICGNNTGNIEKSQNNGTVGGTGSNKGGIAGCNHGVEKITECINTGSVSGKNYVGGICGNNGNQYTTANAEISNCYNTGTVNGNNNVGGINGVNYRSVANCYNTGAVNGTQYVGGVIGWCNGTTTTGCYSIAAVNGTSYIGGVCGINKSETLTYCYYDKDFCTAGGIKGADVEGQATGMTTAELFGSLPTGFDEAAWVAGSYSADSKKITAVYHQLKVFENVPAQSYKLYNFGTNGTDDWQTYTEIYTAAELQKINENLSGNYVLMNDIDVAQAVTDGEITASENGTNWTPIGSSTASFTGKFSGDGHTISGIVINSTSDYQGLFGYLGENATIMNVGVLDSSISGGKDVGGVCGRNENGTIENCYSTGTVSTAGYNVGGVCGKNVYGTIKNCYSTGEVSGSTWVGGVCGTNRGTIKYCYSTGAVSGIREYVGGVCGYNYNATITNCYSTGTVTGSGDYVGGVCGRNENGTIEYCYSTGAVSGTGCVGGVCGMNYHGTITNCYYDTDFYTGNAIGDDQGTANNVTGISTAELCGSTLPTGFDSAVWTAGSAGDVTEIEGNYGKRTYTSPSLKGVGSAYAFEADVYNFGTNGSDDWDTYTEISTADELIALSNDRTKWSGNYVLTADITLTAPATESDSNWTAIGDYSTHFTGKFSGDGHTISGIVINKSNENYQGLFGYSEGTIMNVGVIDSSISGGNNVGGVCGRNSGTIENCYSTGDVSGTGNNVGGVCGGNDGTIKNCYSTGAVSTAEKYVGGVCGDNYSTIKNCYSTGAVSGSNYVGGVCGRNEGGTITSCYYDTDFYTGNAIGDAQGTADNVIGKTTADLCGSLDDLGFDSTVWTAGSFTIDPEDGKKATAKLPQLKVFENTSAPKTMLSLYNFGTNGSDDWDTYTEISTAEALQNINNNLSGNYVLTADITLTAPAPGGSNWTAIGTYSNPFTGKFDGKGHTISGIVINKSGENDQGLFGYSSGLIMNVGVINSSISGGGFVGGVCGYNYGTITNCYNTGAVSGTDNNVGGVCGKNNGIIENCYSTGAVSGSNWVGGVCGQNVGTIENCYYDTDFCSVGGINGQDEEGQATGISTAALCGSTLPTGFETSVWTAGSFTIDQADGKKATATLPQLKVFENTSAPKTTLSLYNFGTDEAPDWDTYTEISTADELQSINLSGNYVLTADITLTAPATEGDSNWTAIGTSSTPFTGKFDGDGHTISGIVINSTADYQGLFGWSEGTIMNVGVIDSSISGGNNVGGVCGYNNGGTIEDCYNTGTVIAKDDYVGGVCGQNQGGTIENCYSTGEVSGINNVGGVCGYNSSNSTIKNCYSTGAVFSTGGNNVGGVCGDNYGTIENCYSTGTVIGTKSVGGVCGQNGGTITNCYSTGEVSGVFTVGGVCGQNNSTITNCYYNADFYTGNAIGENQGTADNVIGKTTAALCGSTLPTGFDSAVWTAGSAGSVAEIDGNYGKRTYTSPSLIGVGSAFTFEADVYNFGTEDDPDWDTYTEISTAEALQNINLSGNYILTTDITLTAPETEGESNWTAIGTYLNPFTGKFSGNGHTISGIVINSTTDEKGLFGCSKGTIMNVGVLDSSISGGDSVGGVCGYNYGTIENCFSTGAVSGTGVDVGGVCGWNEGTITNCYSTGEVNGSGEYVGGVCGRNYEYSTIENCYSTGTVSGTSNVGGVCGYNYSNGTIKNCYSTGAVSGSSNVGGVCGYNNDGTITNCYYDTDFYTANAIGSGTGTETNVTGISTADLCGSTLPEYLSLDNWTAGSYSADGKKATATFPQLKVFANTSAPKPNVSLYNFGTEDDPDWDTYTEISTAEELQSINLSGNYVLTADITLTAPETESDSNWTAIGNDTNPFTGKLDGDGHTISGIVIKSTSNYQGLFGYLGENGTIMNVGVLDSSISGGNYVGGVCGQNYGTIKNCYSTGAVSGAGSPVGGVCGENGGTIKNCYSTGAVSGSRYVGGVCGRNYYGTITNCYSTGAVSNSSEVGGVCGYNFGGTIENCYSTGTVSGTGNNVGGVCGYNKGTIKNCYSTGAVSGSSYVGGVCGYNDQRNTIENCYSTGAVRGTEDYVGGVCGYNDYRGTITNCYSTGAVSGRNLVGGVCGRSENGIITNCYYDKDFCSEGGINRVDVSGMATGKTTAELCGSLPTGFDSTVWTAGSYSEDCKKATATFPQLKVFENTSAPKTTLSLYNFGTEEATDWKIYTEISTAEELIALSKDSTKWSGNYVLTDDITLTAPATENDSNWTAIGTEAAPFTGKFDGDGHTISGIVINKSGENDQGLFGYSKGTIINVGVINSDITGKYNVGGVCGRNYYGTITNCYSTGTVSGSSWVGGVCGYNNGGTIKNCYSTGAVSGSSYVGGVCGRNENSTIENCYSTGTVTGSGDYVGGVCGRNGGTIKNCYSTGAVSGNPNVGGVCGYNSGTIENCYSTGTVSAAGDYVGGVCGYNVGGTIKNCYSTGAVSGASVWVGGVCGRNEGTITNCYNIGAVSGASGYVGGVCGYNYNGTIKNCYYDTDFYTGNAIGKSTGSETNVTGKTTADLCGSLDDLGFDSTVWTAGSYSAVGKKATAIFPQLKVFENTSAPKTTILFYNFGTDEAPDWETYTEISTAEELQNIKNNLSGNYVLTTDITLTAPTTEGGSNWTPIGSGAGFTGKFSGDGHTISGIVIKTTSYYQGLLFGYSTGTIMNVGVIDSSISGKDCVGGVCGQNDGTIKNCYSTGTVSGSWYVGGVCGYNKGTITNCYSTGAVSGTSEVGGVCGDNEGTIKNCYSTGTVSGTGTVGGVCGMNYDSTITNCYYDTDFYTGNAIGSVSGTVTNVTGKTTAELCGSLPAGFDSAVWTAGSLTIDQADGKKATATLPQLKVFENTSAPKPNVSLYNFGTNGSDDWDTYTEISTAEELQNINLSGNYVLTADITLTAPATESDSNWTAIGTSSTPFTGKFSGDGHTISGIVINKSDEDYQGLFGFSKGTIMNVGVIDSSISGSSNVGGVCGDNKGTIKNCYSTGAVSGTDDLVGGVCGKNKGTIKNCYSTGAVSGTSNYVGGVCGYNDFNSTIENCYSIGEVSGSSYVGGVCGDNYDTITNCYYDTDFYTGNAIGSDSGTETNVTGKTTADLCGSLDDSGFDSAVWTAGSFTIDQADGKKATATLPQLKVFENTSAPKTMLSLYNFGTNGSDDWDTYTEISTAEELQSINLSGNYVLTADITLTAPATESDSNWTAIGTSSNPFTGKFDGNGHTISDIVINKSDEHYQGLFGYSTGTIMNVGVLESSISGSWCVGGVCGMNVGTIEYCYSTGAVTGSGDHAGGVCGYNDNGTITNCYSTGVVNGTGYVGGVCGYNNSSTIENCYSTGAVSGTRTVGGVCGWNETNSTIKNCYSTGTVTGSVDHVGGVCGWNATNSTIKNCYSTGAVSGSGDNVGGVCGYNEGGTITNCYYDTDFYTGNAIGSDSGSATNVTGKTTADLCGSLPAGFDSAVWTAGSLTIDQADGKKATATLPQLKVFENTSAPKTTVSLYNFGTNGSDDWDTYTEISTAEELQSINNNLSGNYVLTANITLTAPTEGSSNWTAIGTSSTPFTGKFDGNGHTISGIVINKSDEDYQGLFGFSKGTIMNVGVIDSSISGSSNVGGVCGDNKGTITNCYSTGAVTGSGDHAGGVCGYNDNGTITNCYSTGTVSGTQYVGGVCGYNDQGVFDNCYYNKDSYTGEGLGYYYNALPNDVLGMTTKQFASGEVAYLLNGDQSAMIWKQNIGKDDSPRFVGGTVYRNESYSGCIHQPGTMSYVYNNSDNDPIYAGYYKETVVDPTYTEKGYTLHECTVCGDSYKDNYTDRLLLPAVKNLAVAGKTDSSVTLRWAANTNADGYIIEKSNGSAWERIITVKNNSTTTYQVTGLDKATEYRFRVTPYVMPESTVLRGNSAEITAKTAPTELNGLQAVAATNGTTIRLTWEKNSTATGYIIDKLVDGSWVNVVTIKNNSSVSYTVSGLDSSTAYRFRVTPYTTLGDSTIRGTGMSATAKTAPTALTGLAATGATNGTAIRLTWEKNSTAAGYIIDKLVDGNWVRVKTLTSNSSVSYTVSGLHSSTAYRFRVTPYTMLNETVIKGAGISVTGKTAPTALTGLAATAATNGTAIRLTWDKNSTAAGYIIDKLVDGNWVSVKTLTSNSFVSYTVSGLDSSKAYRFRVTPYTTFNGDIIKSAGVSVTGKTAPAAISGLKIGNATANYITLSWDKNTTASGYIVEKLVGSTWESVVTVKSSSATRYTVTGLNASTSYRFRVTPFTTFGDGTIRGTGASVTGKTLKA